MRATRQHPSPPHLSPKAPFQTPRMRQTPFEMAVKYGHFTLEMAEWPGKVQ